jgi:hypothetical protein
MVRLLASVALCLLLAGDAGAWGRRRAAAYPVDPCPPIYFPAYPLTPAIWGAPAPQPLPPAPPPKPRPPAGVREEEEPVKPSKPPDKSKEADPKDKETPRIPRVKLPPLPGDPIAPELPALRPAGGTKESVADAGKAVEQFLIPADAKRGEPRAEVKVGFFNHSDRAIELQVNGESVQLPSEQYVTLRLTRTFTWSEKGQKGNDVVVPPDADGVEIVFRR